MSPGFFGFYAHIGALIALDNEDLLNEVSSCYLLVVVLLPFVMVRIGVRLVVM